nr:cadherin-like beta sandwich domain-containing protein [uncultured Mucilaginibacter sp.]
MKKFLLPLLLLLFAVAGFAQAPDISYPSPQVYVVNKSIVPLVPTQNGGAVPATVYSKVTTFAGNGVAGFVDATGTAARFKTPFAIANDAAGNVYVVDYGNNAIRKITPAGLVTTFVTGLSNPGGVAVDAAGNVYIADTGNQVIKKATPAGVVTIYAGSGNLGFNNGPADIASFKNPQDVAVDAAGNVYVADYGNHQIRKINTTGVVSVLAGSGAGGLQDGTFTGAKFRTPYGVTCDAAGNVYVADFGNSAIRKITPGGVVTTMAGDGTAGFANGNGSAARFDKPGDVAVDANGNVYVTDSYNSLIRKVTPTGDVTTFAGNLGNFARIDGVGTDAVFHFPIGVTIDANGNLYVSENGSHSIRKILTKGYYIDQPLPAGLSFDPTTGIITGTPTDISASAIYKISAYNDDGGVTTPLDITVRVASNDALLSALTTSTGTLNPAFVPTTKRYVINVPNSTSSISVTPTLSDPNAKLKLNGNAHTSGTSSGVIPLSVGNTTITLQVIAESDTTTVNYTVSIVRARPAVAPPVIAYTSPNTYLINVPITPLSPMLSGGAVPANSYGQVTTFATGFSGPTGITTDPDGNVYVSDDTKQIRKITPSGSVSLFAGAPAGFVNVTGMGADAQGNIYAADAGDNKIRVISPAGVASTLAGHSGDYAYNDGVDTAARFATPYGVTTDAFGNTYVADLDNNLIRKISPANIVSTLAGTTAQGFVNGAGAAAKFRNPASVTTDASGNIFVADKANNVIRKITPAGLVTTFAGSGAIGSVNGNGTAATFETPTSITTDQIDNIYVADAANSKIRKISPAGDVTTIAGSGFYSYVDGIGRLATFNYPQGVAADADGHLYVSDWGNNVVRKIEATGFSIFPLSLPAGLIFDSKTGTISGTPTAKSNNKTFTITAYNLGGSSEFKLDIAVSAPTPDATLSALTLSSGTLTPSFKKSTVTYRATVGQSSIIITPTSTNAGATIKINNVAVVSGSPSTPIPLVFGVNAVAIVVTSSDGTATKQYDINITRTAPSTNANLSAFVTNAGTLSPAFASGTLNYTTSVSNATTGITISPTAANVNATVQVNGVDVPSGSASGAIPLNVGVNVIKVVVTAENGTTIKTYKLTVTRAPSTIATLDALTPSTGTLAPVFAANTTAYAIAVPNTITNIKLTPVTTDAAATIKVNNVAVVSGAASQPIALNAGSNLIPVTVMAEDGSTTKTYNVTVTRAVSSNADLSALTISAGVLSPSFVGTSTSYSASVPNTTNSITLTPTAAGTNATIKVNNIVVASGAASQPIVLNVGANNISVTVLAEDGISNRTYTISVTRAVSANANLADLVLSEGLLSPAFTAANQAYTANVVNATTSITVTPTVADPTATVTVNNVATASGTASAPIPVVLGSNPITIVVTAQDLTTKTYTIDLVRAASADAGLSSLAISSGTLSPAFATGTGNYTATVTNSISSITVTPASNNANAVIQVNNVTIPSGSAANVPLVIGSNSVVVKITAEDGTTINPYTITITRQASVTTTLANITLSAGTLMPAFNPATAAYTATVTNTTSTITLTPTAGDPTETITVNNIATASGTASAPIPLTFGANTINVVVTAQDGINTATYTVTVTRSASTDATLAGLVASAGALSPAFAPGTVFYTVNVANAVATTTVTPTVNDANATVTVNGIAVTSGSPSAAISLNVGANGIPVVVTAQDGSSVPYTVNINRAASADATLSGLAVSAGTLSPGFTSVNGVYTLTVPNASNSITITPTQSNANASITVNNVTVASGSASQAIPLVVGNNTINITVTAENGTTKPYTITVTRQPSSNNSLANLVLSSGSLSPTFATETTAYTASVGNVTGSITLTPTVSDATATVTVNSVAVASGAASAPILLNVGTNLITTVVTAEDGASLPYTLTVTRAASADATLSDLTLSAGALNPVFASGTTSYAVAVANTTTAINVTPFVNEPNATVTVNNTTVTSGSASANLALIVGVNAIAVKVTAQDGSATKTYNITVTRARSSNADLSNLVLSTGSLSPAFDPATTAYTELVPNTVSSITVTPTNADANAVITVNGNTVAGGSASGAIPLAVGANLITIHVTAEDNSPKDYTVTITRATAIASTDANLLSLAVNTGTLTPAFNQATPAYTVAVANATTGIRVTAASSDANATITVNSTVVASGAQSGIINLAVGSNAINVVITAEDGLAQKMYTITVTRAPSTNANLSNITLSSGTLIPAFAPGTISYTASVSNAVSTIKLTPTAANSAATIKVNNVTVASGTASAAIPLVVGPNIITTVVTAQSGATKTYTVTVTRAQSPNADLANLTLSAGTLSPVFAAGTVGYTVSVANVVTTIKLTPTVADAAATVKVNNATVASGAASGNITLVVGANTILVDVIAQDGTPKQYKVVVTRAQSPNANLANLVLSSGSLSPAFSSGNANYTAAVGNAVSSISLTPSVADATASVQVQGVTVASGTASGALPLVVGPNTINVLVTAEDGTPKLYTVTVTRAQSPDATLANLALSDGTLTPAFSSATITYSASVVNSVTGIAVTPSVNEPNATVMVNGITVASGAASANIPLIVGANTITVLVTAQDNNTTKSYKVTVTRAPSPDATLSNLGLSAGTLSPTFASLTTGYTASVGNAINSISITPTVSEPNAAIKVNSVTVANSTASGPIALVVGANTITVDVTAQDGISTKQYIVTVTRAPSNNAFLNALGVSSGTYSPSFASFIYDYTILVTNNVTAMRLTPVLADNTATMTIDGVPASSGAASAPIVLNVGNNFLKVKVIAQDGITTHTYQVIINRALSSQNDLSNLVISSGTLNPSFQSGIADYTASVSNAVTSITLKPTVADPTATVKVNNVLVASGVASGPINLVVGTNTINVLVTAQNGETNPYTVTVTRAPSINADLSNLTANAGALRPVFAPNTTIYNIATVGNVVSTIKLTPTAADATAAINVNGITVISGTASPDIPLNVGANTIPVTVTAQGGNTKKYFVNISRAPSSNKDLAGITLSAGTLDQVFTPGTHSYTTTISNADAGITVTPNTSDGTATVTVNHVAVASGTASNTIPLTVGTNTIDIEVTAQDGTKQTYSIVATREASGNADLANLVPNAGTLSPVFSSSNQSYDISVDNTVTDIAFTPITSDATATVTVNNVAVTSGTASGNLPLALGQNVIIVRVTAQNNVPKDYTVTVTRLKSNNANLSALLTNAGPLTQAFDKDVLQYYVNVANSVTSATITPTVAEPNATIEVLGQQLASGTESEATQLGLGDNDIAVVVTAQDLSTKTYVVTIRRAFSNNANLGGLTISAGTLSPAFAAEVNDYNVTVPYGNDNIRITPTLGDATATVTVNGVNVTDGTASRSIPLIVGQNTITIKVTAADGTPNEYHVVVKREVRPPSTDASLTSLFLTTGELSPLFNRTTLNYTATVQSSVTKTNVVAIVSDPNAKIKINGVFVPSGTSSDDIALADGPNQIFVVVTAEDGTTIQRYNIVVTRANFAMVLPNIFTPNSDGYNDTWVLPNINLYPDCTVKIFNRGGQQVFASVGYGIPWDGTFNGRALQPDVYYYIIDLKHGQGVRSGNVTIVK